MLYLSKSVDLYERPSINGCVGNVVRKSQTGEPVRVLDCIPNADGIPGGPRPDISQSYERLEWLRRNTLDLVQVGEPPNVGFALVPRSMLIDTPF